MKRIAVCALALGLLGCSGKRYSFYDGPTRIEIRGPRTAYTEQPWQAALMVSGEIPLDPVCIVVKVDGQEVGYGIGYINSRITQLPPLRFPVRLYLSKKGVRMPDEWVSEQVVPYSNPDVSGDEWDGLIQIDVELWQIEPHPTEPMRMRRVHRICFAKYKISLSCPNCLADEARN